MPYSVSTLISRRPDLPTSHPPLGGPIHDRTLPPDQPHVSLSDLILAAGEARFFGALHRLGDDDDGILALQAVNSKTMATTQGEHPGHSLETGIHEIDAQDPSSPDPSDDSYDMVEVVSLPDDAHDPASENSCHGPVLTPLASEMFKEELFIRGYLKRPARRPANDAPRKLRTTFTSTRRKVFSQVLGKGHRVAEALKVEQIKQSAERRFSTVASVTLGTPHADVDSPRTDTNTSTFSFDLHEFSYLTAFTTPPCSPPVNLDAGAFEKVCLGNRKHTL